MRKNRPAVHAANTTRSLLATTVYEYVGTIVTAMILLVLIFTFLFRAAGVQGDSMLPNLKNGDRLVVAVHFYQPQYGDIVIINRYTEEPLVKRVIAVAGDTVRIDNLTGQVYRNGQLLHESYINCPTISREMDGEITVPDNCIFVLGDNRSVSKDSRYQEIGMISTSDVVGKAIFRLWPLNKFGLLYGNVEAE